MKCIIEFSERLNEVLNSPVCLITKAVAQLRIVEFTVNMEFKEHC